MGARKTGKSPNANGKTGYIYVNSVGERVVVPGRTKLSALLKESGMFEVRLCSPQEPLLVKAEYHQDNTPQDVEVLWFQP